MTTDPETVRRAFAREHPKHWIGITAEDIPHGWIDDMVKRLFEELNRQMLRAEHSSTKATTPDKAGNYDDDTERRDTDSLIFSRLQGSMQRLTNLEMQRATLRNTKAARSRRAKRAAIRSQILGGHDAEAAGESEGEGQ